MGWRIRRYGPTRTRPRMPATRMISPNHSGPNGPFPGAVIMGTSVAPSAKTQLLRDVDIVLGRRRVRRKKTVTVSETTGRPQGRLGAARKAWPKRQKNQV